MTLAHCWKEARSEPKDAATCNRLWSRWLHSGISCCRSGSRVTLVERYEVIGGVCLNVGCIPSKALLHAAKVIDEAAAMSEHGVVFGEPSIDALKLRGWKNEVVGKLTGGLQQLAKQRKVQIVHGTAKFDSAKSVRVDDEIIEFENALSRSVRNR